MPPSPPAPLSVVTLALSDKTVVNIPLALSSISSYLDCSLNIPLHEACATGSLDLLDRIWCHSQLTRSENWCWCPAMSLQTNRHYKRWQFSQSLIQAIRQRDLALVDWIFRHFTRCVSDVEVVEEAASTGQLEILKFLLEKDSRHTQEDYEAGNESGDGNGVTWGGNDMALAVKNGHSDVVRWLLEHTSNDNRVEFGALLSAAFAGNLPIVKLLILRGVRIPESRAHDLVGIAAYNGHLELLQWLVEQNFRGGDDGRIRLSDYISTRGIVLDMDTTKSAMDSAAANGHLDVVKWLIERGLGRGATSAIHYAALNGHLEVAKYLHAQGFTGCNQITLRMAARGGHLAVLQWLYTRSEDDPKADLFGEHGRDRFISLVPPLASEMADAARYGHLEVVQYLHTIALTLVGKKRKRGESSQQSCKLEMDNVVTGAAGSGHLDVVKWLCTHTTVKSTKQAMAYAASGGHFPVVKWLHENSPLEDFQTEVMDEAARCGDLSLLKWLHTNRPNEMWSTAGIDNAARGGHLHVLRWLLDHKLRYIENDRPVPMLAKKLALKGNYFDALLFVHYEYNDWNSNPVLLANDGPYNEHIKAWFQEELGEADLSGALFSR